MEELFALIKAFNRLEERIISLSAKVDILVKSPFRKITLDEKAACKLLGISERTLLNLRNEGKIPFIKIHRRTLYRTSDLFQIPQRQPYSSNHPLQGSKPLKGIFHKSQLLFESIQSFKSCKSWFRHYPRTEPHRTVNHRFNH